MLDLISREELLKRSYTVVVEDMWHMHQEIEVVNVDDIKKLQPQEEPLAIICYSDKCENCSEILNNLVNERLEHMWIPVSERLPEEMGTYMTTVDYGKHGLATGQRYYYGQGLWEDDCVIAWMPLPQPYKESEDEE